VTPIINPAADARQSPDRRRPAMRRSKATKAGGRQLQPLLDHVDVLSEDQLRRLLREYIEYFNTERVHTSLGDSPAGRAQEIKPPGSVTAIGLPRFGRLHHRYSRREAA
jgi:hypothetical protein